MADQLWTLGAALFGYAAAMLTEYLRDKRTGKREVTARVAARQLAQDDRRDRFQRQTLLALSNAMPTLNKVIGRAYAAGMRELKEHGTYFTETQSTWQTANEALNATYEVGNLVVRVLDDDLRSLAGKYVSTNGQVPLLPQAGETLHDTEARVRSAFAELPRLNAELTTVIGKHLRELYGQEA